jgi:hypothetical protein
MVRLVFLIATVVAMTAAQQQLCTQIQTAHPAMITVQHLPPPPAPPICPLLSGELVDIIQLYQYICKMLKGLLPSCH